MPPKPTTRPRPSTPPPRPIHRPSVTPRPSSPPVRHSTPPVRTTPTPRPSTPPVHHDRPPTRPTPPPTHHDRPPEQHDRHPPPVVIYPTYYPPPVIRDTVVVNNTSIHESVSSTPSDFVDTVDTRAVKPTNVERNTMFDVETSSSRPVTERSYHETRDNRSWLEKHGGALLILGIIIGAAILIPVLVFAIPWPSGYLKGPYQAGNIYVVDSVSGNDVSSHVEYFNVYVTNDTNDLNIYYWLNNATSIPEIHGVLAAIDSNMQYKDVVLETFGSPSSPIYNMSYSVDLITTGENYIWLEAV